VAQGVQGGTGRGGQPKVRRCKILAHRTAEAALKTRPPRAVHRYGTGTAPAPFISRRVARRDMSSVDTSPRRQTGNTSECVEDLAQPSPPLSLRVDSGYWGTCKGRRRQTNQWITRYLGWLVLW